MMQADCGAHQILAPLAIGLTVFLAHLVAIPVTNCCINRARPCRTSTLPVDSVAIHTRAKPLTAAVWCSGARVCSGGC